MSCIPSDINFLSPNGFKFVITKLPELTYFCQQAPVPGISLGEASFGTAHRVIPLPGETLTFDTMNIRFIVDEKMNNYKAVYDWLIGLGFPTIHQEYTNLINNSLYQVSSELSKNVSEGLLHILGSNNLPVRTISFVDVFPVGLESLVLDSTNEGVSYLTATANFAYSYYKFV